MYKRLIGGLLAVLAVAIFSTDAAALVQLELGDIAAGLRVPAVALWVVGPMALAVAGAVGLGWRRAATATRTGLLDK